MVWPLALALLRSMIVPWHSPTSNTRESAQRAPRLTEPLRACDRHGNDQTGGHDQANGNDQAGGGAPQHQRSHKTRQAAMARATLARHCNRLGVT
jgi:hypothetical protein